jgi:hypothetical protein
MSQHPKRGPRHLTMESLEGRALLSGTAAGLSHDRAAAEISGLNLPSSFNAAGEKAILTAYFGGAGHEWIAMVLKDMRSVRTQFIGTSLQYTAPGMVAEEPPYLLSTYTGDVHDRVAPSVAGMVALKKQQIELGVIMRGPFTNYNGTDYVTFGINRGAGGSLSAVVPSEPWIQADALVTIAVGPNGSTYSGTITDRTTGQTQAISPNQILVDGPTLRVLLNASQLPSEGLTLKKYTFAVWTATEPNPTLRELASVVPQNEMIPIGIETNVKPTMS